MPELYDTGAERAYDTVSKKVEKQRAARDPMSVGDSLLEDLLMEKSQKVATFSERKAKAVLKSRSSGNKTEEQIREKIANLFAQQGGTKDSFHISEARK